MDGKKERKILAISLSLTMALGFSCELIKVPMTIEDVKIDKIPVQKIEEETRDMKNYSFSIPKDYELAFDLEGNPYCYKETKEKKTEVVPLSDYITYKLTKKIKKSF